MSCNCNENGKTVGAGKRKSYWSDLVDYYEKRNAELEKQYKKLAERVRIMELTLPTVLMGSIFNCKIDFPDLKRTSSTSLDEWHSCYNFQDFQDGKLNVQDDDSK